ncbi:MAG: ArnT family glycosyltransferase [Lysobacterales bacterium]
MRLLLLAIAALGLASLWLRPTLPVDETRYLAVAWEMWWRDDFVLPWLNGEPYHHKPPLLFWLIHAGWSVFGVNDVWPRLLSPLAAVAAVFGVRGLARALWPERPAAAALAPILAFGSLYLFAYTSLLMFDTLLLALLLAAWLQLHRLLSAPTPAAAALFLLWAALALLCRGPVALVHLLAPILIWPWWRPPGQPALKRLWLPLLLTVLATLPVLLWALAASERGGEAFRQALLFGQTLDRVQGAMGHPRPFGFYLPFLLLLPLPWSLWPPAWRALGRLRALARDSGARFAMATLAVASLIHLGIAGKQVHYLIPMLALGYLLLARLLAECGEHERPARRIALAGSAALLLLLALASGPLSTHYPLPAIGASLATAQAQGRPLAYIGIYQGEFHFAGRLRQPIAAIAPAAAQAWAQAHPQGLLLARDKRVRGALAARSEGRFDYKRSPLWLLPAQAFLDGAVQASEPGSADDEASTDEAAVPATPRQALASR